MPPVCRPLPGLCQSQTDDLLVRCCLAGWQAEERDTHGHLQAHPVNFPSGIKSLVDYAHAAGLKLGIYTAMGNGTCADDNNRGQALGLGCDFTQIPACPRAKLDIDDFVSWGMCVPLRML